MAATYSAQETKRAAHDARVTGWWVFAGCMLGLAGTLNVIWGIAAVANSSFFVDGQRYILTSDLNAWGWATVVLGLVQLIASLSLFAGNAFGRWIGIFSATVAAVVALLTLPAYPFWSICLFALSVIIVYELAKPAPDPQA
jgi:hypothetical protein